MFVSRFSHNNDYSIVYWQWRKSTIVNFFFVNLTLMMFERFQRCNNYRRAWMFVYLKSIIKFYVKIIVKFIWNDTNSFKKNINSFEKKNINSIVENKKTFNNSFEKNINNSFEKKNINSIVEKKKNSTTHFEKNIKFWKKKSYSISWSIQR